MIKVSAILSRTGRDRKADVRRRGENTDFRFEKKKVPTIYIIHHGGEPFVIIVFEAKSSRNHPYNMYTRVGSSW